MKILANILVQNNEKWLPLFKTMFEKLKNKYDIELWIYENNSIDNTKKNLFGDHIISEDIMLPSNLTRTQRISFLRNKLKNSNLNNNYDYVLLIDSNTFFDNNTLMYLLDTLENNPTIAMAVPHAMVKTSLPCQFFYDTFATITENGEKCGQFTSIIECKSQYPQHDRHCHRITGTNPLVPYNERYIKVKSTFAGFALIRFETYKKSSWECSHPDDCEHWKFCEQIIKDGDIVIDKKSKSLWVENL